VNLNLAGVDWNAALAALGAAGRASTPAGRRLLADASSLSALAAPDFATGAGRLGEADALEPGNPLHTLRRALFLLRFGEPEQATLLLEPLAASGLAPPVLTRALAALRQGELKRAANIAAEAGELPGAGPLPRLIAADAKARDQPKIAERQVGQLREPGSSTAVAELLARLALARPAEAPKFLEREVPRLCGKGTREAALLAELGRLYAAPADELERAVAAARPGSRREEIMLLLLGDRLGEAGAAAASAAWRAVAARLPGRPALRRRLCAELSRHAVDLAAREQLRPALAIVQQCERLEPVETVHRQNRAALLTLLGEADAAHEAWADLDRHHYRLALLGRLDRGSAHSYARPHRMFAQQARLTPEDARGPARLHLGVFRREQDKGHGEVRLVVNQERLDTDPEQLRQWLHHRRAELTFAHVALGDGARTLLGPEDARSAGERVAALALAARSLGVLVEGEGERLADALAARWRRIDTRVATRYSTRASQAPADRDAQRLHRRHLENLGDLVLLCRRWRPDPRRPQLVDEVLDFLRAEAPFLDGPALSAELGSREQPERDGGSLRFLAGYLRMELERAGRGGGDGTPLVLGRADRAHIIGELAAALLLGLALRTQDEVERAAVTGTERALELVARARREAGDTPAVEYCSARILLLARRFDEARAALTRFHALGGPAGAKARAEFAEDVEELQRILDKQAAAGDKGVARRGGDADDGADGSDERDAAAPRERALDELEAEIERLPTSVRAYQALAFALAAQARFAEARSWAEQAVARCLSRQGQLRARELGLELDGLQLLHGLEPQAAQVYLRGSRAPALALLDRRAAALAQDPAPAAPANPPAAPGAYALDYLHGLCLLAARRRADAEAAFARALAGCTRQLYLAVLRPLAQSAEPALLAEARRAIDDALADGRTADAVREAAALVAAASKPEDCLLDLARAELAAVVAALGRGSATPPAPAITTRAPWQPRLAAALATPDGLERARRLCALVTELAPAAASSAATLAAKIASLDDQVASARVQGDAARLMEQGKWAEALTLLDTGKAGGARAGAGAGAGDRDRDREPRVEAQRALLLLKLERFAEADLAADRATAGSDAAARELAARYPDLACKARLGAATRLLRAKDARGASAVLAGAAPRDPEQQLELTYCRAFASALDGYRELEAGAHQTARRHFVTALELLEPRLAYARSRGHVRLVGLHDKLDAELVRLTEGAR